MKRRGIVGFCASIVIMITLFLSGLGETARAESVFVRYRGTVALDPFKCTDVTDSSVVGRVCYDAAEEYMLIKLGGTYYQYCEVPGTVVTGLLSASSKGSFYGSSIKGSGGMGPYDCRIKRVPQY